MKIDNTAFLQNSIVSSCFYSIIFYLFFLFLPNISLAKHIITFSLVPPQYIHNDRIDSQHAYGILYLKKLQLTLYMNLLLGAGINYTSIRSDDSISRKDIHCYAISLSPKVGLSFPIYKDYIAFYTGLGAHFQYESIMENRKFQDNYIINGELFTGVAFQYKYFYTSIEYSVTQKIRSRGITLSLGVIF
ncbi:MAG: hypothetical protein ACRCV3_06125 [Desulfovibrionaceae bacterium]